jgi:hypothetical protein
MTFNSSLIPRCTVPRQYAPLCWVIVLVLLLLPSTVAAQLPAGMMGWWNMEEWCSGKFAATYLGFTPDRILRGLQRAKSCGIGLVAVYPRRLYTSNGENKGPYSGSKHRALDLSYARYLPADTLKKYVASRTLLGIVVGDDYGCADCWGGTKIPISEARDAANHSKATLASAPIGIRLDALAASVVSGWQIDFMWAQWTASPSKLRTWGTPTKWFAANATKAQVLGVRVFYGQNVEDCYGTSSARCPPDKITTWGGAAVDQSQNCGYIPWTYISSVYTGTYRSAFQDLFTKARSKSFSSCKVR